MTDQKVAYQGEAQLARWSDSNTQGPTITLRLPDSDDLAHFRGATIRKGDKAGQLYAVMIVEVDPDAVELPEPPPPKIPAGVSGKYPYGGYFHELHRVGWFFNPAVWKAIGTDAEFLAFVRTQPCSCQHGVEDGGKVYHCSGDIVAAHVRRIANGAGVGIKPQYSAIALCDGHHRLQHQVGEQPFGGADWFDKMRASHLVRWVKSVLYRHLQVDSLAKVDPAVFKTLIHEMGIGHTLPREVE